jgi:hypothetical protein
MATARDPDGRPAYTGPARNARPARCNTLAHKAARPGAGDPYPTRPGADHSMSLVRPWVDAVPKGMVVVSNFRW